MNKKGKIKPFLRLSEIQDRINDIDRRYKENKAKEANIFNLIEIAKELASKRK